VRNNGPSPTLSSTLGPAPALANADEIEIQSEPTGAAAPIAAGALAAGAIAAGTLAAAEPSAAEPVSTEPPPAIEPEPAPAPAESAPVTPSWLQDDSAATVPYTAPADEASPETPIAEAPAVEPAEPAPFQDDLRTVAVTPETFTPEVTPVAPVEPPSSGIEVPTAEVSPPGTGALAIGADGQVVPPEDLEGPGWAFSNTSEEESESGESAVHDEARRLARLLVSEIKLYNEEQVEEGRQSKNIYSRLREDIDRSKQIYEERIHPSIRGKTDFFRDELVRILAGGDADALGM